ncbi:MAG: hypothetical protein OXU20_29425, partial [Myxococcales bacterium]|nr:hypothetical protein [Myxococcales bacterium]
ATGPSHVEPPVGKPRSAGGTGDETCGCGGGGAGDEIGGGSASVRAAAAADRRGCAGRGGTVEGLATALRSDGMGGWLEWLCPGAGIEELRRPAPKEGCGCPARCDRPDEAAAVSPGALPGGPVRGFCGPWLLYGPGFEVCGLADPWLARVAGSELFGLVAPWLVGAAGTEPFRLAFAG